jgi:uncharacterized protein YecE (DUF72 family)
MGQIYAGTSGWAYASWKPDFYPAKLPAAKFLSHYSNRLNSVEVNYTFRRFPSQKLLQGWVESTPPEFKFAFKANQRITHFMRLRGAGGQTLDFVGALEPMQRAKKLGPILFQLPPQLKLDLKLLEDFLAAMPKEIRAAFEFRHDSWFNDEVFSALRKANAALCQAESENLVTPQISTADFFYLRLRNESYSPTARNEIAERVKKLLPSGDVFTYFKHEETAEGALYAEGLLSSCRP